MGLFDRLRKELIDIVEWVDDSQHTLVWRFPRFRNEIKQGAQLIVRPGQMAVFVSRGKVADTFGPGTHRLETGNLPILSQIEGWKYGFESPIKSEVYFVSTRQVTDLKWGTPNPVILRDPDFGPLRVRAFGTYTMQAVQPVALLEQLVGADSSFDTNEVTELLRSMIIESLSEALADADVSAIELSSHYREIGEEVRKRVVERIDDEYGLDVPALMVVNVSLPPEVEKAIDARSSMTMIGDVDAYQRYQLGKAIPDAATSPGGGGAAEGLGLGMGLAMAQQAMRPGLAGGAPGMGGMMPPPPPAAAAWHVAANGVTSGPFGAADLARLAGEGVFGPQSLVWTAGMGGWQAAASVPALAAMFAPAAPPPPPPPAAPPSAPPSAPRA